MNQVASYEAVQDLFSETARRFSSNTAIESGRRSITYGQLEANAERLASTLSALGISKGSIVAIFLRDPIEVITAILATLKAGGVFCPFDPTFPDKRLEVMFSSVSPRWCVTESQFTETIRRITSGEKSAPELVLLDEEHDRGRSYSETWISDPESPCSIYFTSGSTGKPKAILGRLRGIDHYVRWEAKALGLFPGARVSQLASPSFDGFLKDAFVPLCAGGVVCAPESRNVVLNAGMLADWLDVERIEVLHCVPSVFRSLINQKLTDSYFAALQYVVLAGEPLLPADVKRWMEVFGDRIKLVNLYGPTETTILKVCHFVTPEDTARSSVPIGKPISGAAVLVVDQQGEPCGIGEVGEIYIRTPYCALGYHGEPELTRKVFIQNPFNDDPSDIVYKTGDYGRLMEDGNLEFVGRRDHQVKVRGVRVELGEIENLLRAHQSISDVTVVDQEDAEGNKFLVAYVTMSNGTGSEHLRDYLAELLPEAMLPSAFVELDQLPRTLNGKIDRNALPPLEVVQAERETSGAGPRSPIEEIVGGIWCEVLSLPAIGRDDNFFNLGGHSLMVTLVILRVRETLNIELPIRSVFEAPTVAQFSQLIAERIAEGTPAELTQIEAVPRDQDLPLSFSQQRMWFFEHLALGTTAFYLPLGLRLKGPLNIPALQQTFGEISRRHENLRTVFPPVNNRPVQIIQPPSHFNLPLVDLSVLPEAEREQQARRLADQETLRPFNLAEGPLVRTMLLRMDQEDHIVLSTMHHIISDGQSLVVVTAEMSALYNAFSQGQPSPLAELSVQYADYAVWQRNWLQGEVLEKRLAYWRGQLEDAPRGLSLPQQRSRQRIQKFKGGMCDVNLSPELTEALKELSRREGVTLLMALISGFVLLLSQYTDDEDIVVGTVSANRERAEAEKLIGILAEPLVLRVNLNGTATFRDALKRVREVCLDAYTYQLPAELLRRDFKSRGADVDTVFNMWIQLDRHQRETFELAGLQLEQYQPAKADTKFELSMVLTETATQVVGELAYDDRIFTAKTIARMLDKYIELLTQMTADPDQNF